ncbi:MAG TPA: helix-hairpin-helix domain-containing protein [Pirellulales bacterium]|nr:helix-hairpin-helix domain-containing protein [Pirellulales bacterium]
MKPKRNPISPRKQATRPAGRMPRVLLRRADQLSVAALTLSALVALCGWWIAHGGAGGRLIEIEHAPPQSAQFLVDINQADWPELSALPGVGETLAKRIVAVRRDRGPFADHNELGRVPGIGPRTLERVRPYLLPMAESHSMAGR